MKTEQRKRIANDVGARINDVLEAVRRMDAYFVRTYNLGNPNEQYAGARYRSKVLNSAQTGVHLAILKFQTTLLDKVLK